MQTSENSPSRTFVNKQRRGIEGDQEESKDDHEADEG